MKYLDIVFLQGDESVEPLQILDNDGVDAALEYLKQWDYGEDYNIRDESPKGTKDRSYVKDGYEMTYSLGLGYIGLCRIIED